MHIPIHLYVCMYVCLYVQALSWHRWPPIEKLALENNGKIHFAQQTNKLQTTKSEKSEIERRRAQRCAPEANTKRRSA